MWDVEHSLAEFLVQRFKEATTALSHDDIRRTLSDALPKGDGQYRYLCDVFGDDDSGDCVYNQGGCCYKAPYSMGSVGGKRTAQIDTDSAVEVLPRTIYDEKADDDDHMTGSMEESTRLALGLWERFISKDARKSASASDFAGNYDGSPNKKSFPILQAGDVMAAVRSIGRGVAGGHSATSLKNRIKSIANKKGFPLPDAWKDDSSKEAERELTGEYVALKEGAVGQDGTAYLKLIAPGWGSSGYYSKEVLKRDGPQLFKAGTKNYWNHPTATEEAERPEGDLRDLASVLSEDAAYHDDGPAGPGLYAKASVFPTYREPVDSLAKHIGMSIRAMGTAKEGTAEGRKGAIIEKLTRAQSVDYVTSPGAGGKVLQLFEAARAAAPIQIEESSDMDEAQVKKLIETAVTPLTEKIGGLESENKKLRERLALATDAPAVLNEALKAVRLPDAARERITRRCLEAAPMGADGKLDAAKFKTLIEAELKDEGEYLSKLSGGRIVVGMGGGAVTTDPATLAGVEKQLGEAFDEEMKSLSLMLVGEGDGNKPKRKAFREGRAA